MRHEAIILRKPEGGTVPRRAPAYRGALGSEISVTLRPLGNVNQCIGSADVIRGSCVCRSPDTGRLVRTNQPSTSDSRIGRSPTTHETSELVEPAGSDAPNKCLRRSETPIYPDEDGEIDTDSSPECRPHDERNRSSGALGAYNPAHAKGGFSTFASSSRGFPRAARFSLALEFPLVVFCRFGDGAGR